MVVVPELANEYGLHEGLVLRQLHYWLQRATCFEDGKPWVHKSISEWAEEFTWWERSTIHRLLTKLAEKELITIRISGKTYYTIHYEKLTKTCRDVLLMLSESRTEAMPEPVSKLSEIRTTDLQNPVMLSEIQTETPTNSVMSSENRTEVSENRTANNKEVTEITTENTTEGERARALPSGIAGVKVVHLDSPYLDARRFVNGFVPPGTGRNAVEVYYERFKIHLDAWRLSKPQEDDLVRNCKDLALLREVVTAYDQANYQRPRNLKLIMDWYRDPSRFRNNRNGTSNGNHQSSYERPESAQFTKAEWDAFLADPNRKSGPF